jgi:sialic acid synthase
MNYPHSETAINKPWGHYQVLWRASDQVVKILVVTPGQALSLQRHEHRDEHWTVLEGVADVQLDSSIHVLRPQETITIPCGSKHRLSNSSSENLTVLELQTGDILDEADIIRYKDRYGRPANAVMSGAEGVSPRSARQWHSPSLQEGPVLICEIGCNHKGDMATALEMIGVAAQFCKANVIKFQKRSNRELLTLEEYDAPHPNPANSYGDTYGDHREYLEFDIEQHKTLKQACEEWGAVYSTSVWDLTSARQIAELAPAVLKIASATNTDFELLDYLCRAYDGEIHISLGMTLREEKEAIVEQLDRHGRLKDTVLFHCISGYPVDEEELYLLEITELKKWLDGRVKGIGFSGHHRGIAADVAALTLGATYFERHFTLDRTWKGTDHAASLEPDGFRRLARDLRNVKTALKPNPNEIAPIEKAQREKLKKFKSLTD